MEGSERDTFNGFRTEAGQKNHPARPFRKVTPKQPTCVVLQRLRVKELVRIIWIKIVSKSSAPPHESLAEAGTVIGWFQASSAVTSRLHERGFIGPDSSVLVSGRCIRSLWWS